MELIYSWTVDCKHVSTNSLYGLSKLPKGGGQRHKFLSKEGKNLHSKVCEGFIEAYGLQEPIDYKVGVKLHISRKYKREFDLDNAAKGILDGITKSGAWLDDDQVYSLLMTKEIGNIDCISIEIYKLH